MALSAIPTTIPTSPPMSFDVEIEEHEHQKEEQSRRLWDWLRKLRRDEHTTPSNESQKPDTPPQTPQTPQRSGFGRRFSRKVGVGLPRSTTFSRQQDEHRKNLEPVKPPAEARRQLSGVHPRALSSSPKPLMKRPKRETSAPDLGYHSEQFPSIDTRINARDFAGSESVDNQDQIPPPPPPPPPLPPAANDDAVSEASYETSQTVEEEIRLELEKKWILNLSMHFRDKSPREKFFVTYAQTPQKWRRVTVSCDYRNTEVDSLEADLQAMGSQREKSARVYESLRGSLADIQFYDTVTNLKLETRDDRLHVHVTEDVNEIIAYPPVRCIQHLDHVKKYRESELHFVEHMSGFVYKVDVAERTWIKKEIPGPDSVDEFLYEVNALSNLTMVANVIELKGLVISDDETHVKGVLIAYAEKNALVDIIYDNRGNLPWARRERWARQIIKGLSEIHEAGFVQGDFTLSNIVIDGNDEVQIIDINRRGCPVGWEPPEIAQLITSGQRISMFIGIKSDLFQLGMVLWGLAMEEDEPERQPRPLSLENGPEEIPGYFRGLVARCLHNDPVMRSSAKDMLREFPASVVVNDPFDETMPELKPAQMFPAIPIVKGSTHRAYTKSPETRKAEDREAAKGTTAPSSKHCSDEELDDRGPKYTEMLNEPHESTSAHLKAPTNQEAGSSVEPQPSSRDLNDCAIDLTKQSTITSVPQTSVSPAHPKPLSSHHSSSLNSQKRDSTYHEASETIQLDRSTKDDSWEAITGNGTSPYEIPLATLDSNTEQPEPPPLPSTSHRRIDHLNRNSGLVPSPPLHVDSGLADVDNDPTPRSSEEIRGARHANSSGRGSGSAPHAAHANNSPRDDRNGNGNGNTGRTSDDLVARNFQHVDSGLADMNFVGIGGGIGGLSFKERVHRSGTIAPGLGEEIAAMVGEDDGVGAGEKPRDGPEGGKEKEV